MAFCFRLFFVVGMNKILYIIDGNRISIWCITTPVKNTMFLKQFFELFLWEKIIRFFRITFN
jgi:hypothetical protein